MIKILHREFGEACLVVGVADGTGSAEDPDGLNHAELLRLFEEALPISEFRTEEARSLFRLCFLLSLSFFSVSFVFCVLRFVFPALSSVFWCACISLCVFPDLFGLLYLARLLPCT